MPMRTRKTVLVQIILGTLACLALGLPGIALAAATPVETNGTVLNMHPKQGAATRAQIDLPPRGTTMQRVTARRGAPSSKHAPVGDPPITRWDYPGYSMYFEYNLFLHAVVPGDPEPLVHKDQLQHGG